MDSNIQKFYEKSIDINKIDDEFYNIYDVKKGLRNEDGTGVLVRLTKIADVVGYEKVGNKKLDVEGKLYYRGYSVEDLIGGANGRSHLFEEVCFLIIFGYLPNKEELEVFKNELASRYDLPNNFLESNIINTESFNIMNKLQQEVLMLYNFDKTPEDISVEATIDKGMDLIAKIPYLAVYAYRTKSYKIDKKSLVIHHIDPKLSIAQNILLLLRDDGVYSQKEAQILDSCLVVHADHGGGNNSTFTNVVISSTGTDIYSAFSGAIGSLKGPRHGGANHSVIKQMNLAIEKLGLNPDDEQLENLINDILGRNFNDNSGLIYGIGHAVYTLSDPRCKILKQNCYELAVEKNQLEKFDFYERFEKMAIKIIKERKNLNLCANVDFYSGFVYQMLDIPEELYTPLFVIGRTVGWLAHNVENKVSTNKIIRPAAKFVGENNEEYLPLEKR